MGLEIDSVRSALTPWAASGAATVEKRDQLLPAFALARQIGNPVHRFLTELLQALAAPRESVKRRIGELARGGVLSRRLAESRSAAFDVENIIADLEQESDGST